MDVNTFFQQNAWWLLLITAWSLVWKGLALYRAARLEQKVWFVVFMIVNTVGILEIFYLYYFSKQQSPTTKPAK